MKCKNIFDKNAKPCFRPKGIPVENHKIKVVVVPKQLKFEEKRR